MAISKPYRRNCRQFTDGTYTHSAQYRYILDPEYSKDPEHYIRAFLLIQKDLKELFDYIDPSDINLKCYSFRIHELLMRICIEIEANFKAILREHGYTKKAKPNGCSAPMNMSDYNKLESTHKLSSYRIKIPFWRGQSNIITPYVSWSQPNKPNPAWYMAYHETKHDRHMGFENANLENLLGAVCGLLALLSAQFHTQDFSTGSVGMAVEDNRDEMEAGIGDYFRIEFPVWAEDECYSFTYEDIQKNLANPDFFQIIDYTKIK